MRLNGGENDLQFTARLPCRCLMVIWLKWLSENMLADSMRQMSIPCKTASGFAAKVISGSFRVLDLWGTVLFETSDSFTFLHNVFTHPFVSIDFDVMVFYWEREQLMKLLSYLCWQIHSPLLITAITVNNWQLWTSLGHRRLYQSFLLIKRGIYVSVSIWDQYTCTHITLIIISIMTVLLSTAAHNCCQ